MLKKWFKKKDPFKVIVAPHDRQFAVTAGHTLLESALAAGLGFPHDCRVGTCGSCRYRLVEGKISELNSSAMGLSAEDFQNGYRLGCQTIVRSDLKVWLPELDENTVPLAVLNGEIRGASLLTENIIELCIVVDGPMNFVPGQYADLEVEAVLGSRSYSFAAPPLVGHEDSLCFHVRHVPGGKFSGWLFGGSRIGAKIKVSGPRGRFHMHGGDGPVVCIGGGTGLAPLKCILEAALKTRLKRPVSFLYGARTQSDLYCLQDIDTLSHQWPVPFTFIPVLSNEPLDSAWTGRRGFVSDYVEEVQDIKNSQAYLCGPPPMVDAAETLLRRYGMPADAIFADRFFDRSMSASQNQI